MSQLNLITSMTEVRETERDALSISGTMND